MNDARISQESIDFERAKDKEIFRLNARDGVPAGRPRGVLTAEDVAARQALLKDQPADETGTLAVEVQPAAPVARVESSDTSASLRYARLGVVAVVVLVLLLLWIRQRS